MGGSGLLASAWVIALVSAFLWSGGKLFGHLQKVSTADAAFNIPLICEGSFAIAFIPCRLSHTLFKIFHQYLPIQDLTTDGKMLLIPSADSGGGSDSDTALLPALHSLNALCYRLKIFSLDLFFLWMLFMPVSFIRAAEQAGVGKAGCWRNPLSVHHV